MVEEIIVDTSALVEYAFATEKGKIVRDAIESGEKVVIIPSIVLGEFASKLERSGAKNVLGILEALGQYSVVVPLGGATALKAGQLHANLRKNEDSISLVDCIVMETAIEHGNALVITTDRHFGNYKNAKIL